jgi:Rod binding domain-containing protein
MQVPPSVPAPPIQPALARQARALEAAFLAEMLKHAAPTPAQALGGGVGEGQFHSFLREEQARRMVDTGGLGLAEHLYQSLVKGTPNDLA